MPRLAKIAALAVACIVAGAVGIPCSFGLARFLKVFTPIAVLNCGLVGIAHKLYGKSPLMKHHHRVSKVFGAIGVASGLITSCLLLPCTSLKGGIWRTIASVLILYCNFAVFIQTVRLSNPKLRSTLYNVLVSYPCTFYCSGLIICFPFFALAPWTAMVWAPAPLLVMLPPFFISFCGLIQSLLPVPWTTVKITVGANAPPFKTFLERVPASALPVATVSEGERNGIRLRIVQLTDLHLGPFLSVEACAEICKQAVALKPDLVLLTGDYHTPESEGCPGSLAAALAPLSALQGKVFASLGNHDKDYPAILESVRIDLKAAGVKLLEDEHVNVNIGGNAVQVIGFDYPVKGRNHIDRLFAAAPVEPGTPRICLIHTPMSTVHVPLEAGVLVLSGHTHGGQAGLLSIGSNLTALSFLLNQPDHGLWGLGKNRLYIHRGNGFRSLTCSYVSRIGVPAENSLLDITWLP